MDSQQTTSVQSPVSPAQTTAIPIKPLPTRTPRSLIVFLLFALPPVAWFLMWIDTSYHHWFSKMLIISGMLSSIFIAYFYLTAGIQTAELHRALGTENAGANTIILVSTLGGLIAAILQILLGVFIHYYIQRHGLLSKPLLAITIVLLTASLTISFLPPLVTIQTIYSTLLSHY